MSTGREIRLIEEDDGWWSAVDEEMGVASQGPSRGEALENLDEAVELTEDARADDADVNTTLSAMLTARAATDRLGEENPEEWGPGIEVSDEAE